jgi:PPM family protein phosphatase
MPEDFRKLVFAQKTDRGLVREINEDACGYRLPERGTAAAAFGALFLVADGIGGIGRGEEASRTAVDTTLATYYDADLDDEDPRERIIAAVQDANEAVRARARTLNLQMLGTTLAGAIILSPEKAFLFNVGDSRIYRVRGETIDQMTSDQASIDATDNQTSYAKAKLTAFVGQFQPILPQLIPCDLQKDDILLICSDGLWGLVEPHEISAVVGRYAPQKAVDVLIQMVHERGARDNVTVTIIQNRQQSNPVPALVALAVLVLALIAGAFALLQPSLLAGAATEQSPSITASFAANTPDNVLLTDSPQLAATDENHGQLVIRTPSVQDNTNKEH